MTNESDLPMLLAGGPTPVFSGYLGTRESDEATLALIPDDTTHLDVTGSDPLNASEVVYVPPSPVDGCWRWPHPDHDLTPHAVLGHVEIPPGETVASAYSVLDYRNETCFPAGTYEFENSVGLLHGTREKHRFESETQRSVSLRFALVVDDGGTMTVSNRPPTVASENG